MEHSATILAQTIADTNRLDITELGLCGIAYWCWVNHYEDARKIIGDYIWEQITAHLTPYPESKNGN